MTIVQRVPTKRVLEQMTSLNTLRLELEEQKGGLEAQNRGLEVKNRGLEEQNRGLQKEMEEGRSKKRVKTEATRNIKHAWNDVRFDIQGSADKMTLVRGCHEEKSKLMSLVNGDIMLHEEGEIFVLAKVTLKAEFHSSLKCAFISILKNGKCHTQFGKSDQLVWSTSCMRVQKGDN
jgi:hypothetical protein